MDYKLFSLAALRIAEERAREADRYRWLSVDAAPETSSASLIRRSLARGVAGLSRGSAWVVRRLDSCVADDLGRSLTPTE